MFDLLYHQFIKNLKDARISKRRRQRRSNPMVPAIVEGLEARALLSGISLGDPSLANIEPTVLQYTEKATTPVTGTISVSVVGGSDLNQATIQITGNYQSGQDRLIFTDTDLITGSWDATSGILTLTGVATSDQYQQALRSVSYYNRSDNPNPMTRVVTFQAGSATLSNTLSRTIVINPINDPPVVTLDSGTLNYYSNTTVQISPGLTVTDPDSDYLYSATVKIAVNYQIYEDFLLFNSTPTIKGVWDFSTGTLFITGKDTVSNYRTALRTVSYYDNKLIPNTSTRTVSFVVNDGDLNSNLATRDINVIRVNNAPVLSSLETTTLNYVQDSPAVLLTQTIAVTDPEDYTLTSATVKISSGYQSTADALQFTNTAKITGVWNSSTGTLTLTGVDSLSNYRAALRTITFTSSSVVVGSGVRTVSFQVNDGKDPSNTLSRNIAVTGIPHLSGIETTPLAYTVQNAAKVITSTLQVGIYDAGNITSAQVHIVNVQPEDVLAGPNVNGITSTWDPTSGTLTLSGASSAANYQAALQAVTYRNPSSSPSSLRRQISFQVFEGTWQSNIVTRNINFTTANDQPELYNVESTALAYKANTGNQVISNSIRAFDPDHLTLVSAVIQITGNYRMGQDVLSFIDTPTIKGTWTPATGKLVLQGTDTVANYQAALRSVTYSNLASQPSTVTRTVSFRISNGAVPNAWNSNTVTRDIAVSQ